MLERKSRCPNNRPHHPSVHCAGACSKTWRCAACGKRRNATTSGSCGALLRSSGGRRETATAEDIRRFQVHQAESGVQAPTINCSVSALRFFFTVTLDRPDLSRRFVLVRHPRKLPTVLSVEEVGRLLEAAPGLKHDVCSDQRSASPECARRAGQAAEFRASRCRRTGEGADDGAASGERRNCDSRPRIPPGTLSILEIETPP